MKPKPKPKAKKKPQDATMRNVRAANKRLNRLENLVAHEIDARIRLAKRILDLEELLV